MTHTVHPYAHRLGIIRDWQSRWFGLPGRRPGPASSRGGNNYQQFLQTDILVREYLAKQLRGLLVERVEIERGSNFYRVIIKTARPGLLIGRQGEGANRLREGLLKYLKRLARRGRIAPLPKEFKLDIEEARRPESRAPLVAQMVLEGLEKRLSAKRVLGQVVEKVLANKQVKGVKITVSGRLGGADIARSETLKKGSLPLQTFKADIDFARARALMDYGSIGIKVWIYRSQVAES